MVCMSLQRLTISREAIAVRVVAGIAPMDSKNSITIHSYLLTIHSEIASLDKKGHFFE